MEQRSIDEQAIIDLLARLPIPIVIERCCDEKLKEHWYRFQVGTPTEEVKQGKMLGCNDQFLDALYISLCAAMK